MKAAFQHTTIISLFCLAGIVLAAQNWHILHSRAIHINPENEVIKIVDAAPECSEATDRPSVLDAGILFACW